jgi:hypothetical protein
MLIKALLKRSLGNNRGSGVKKMPGPALASLHPPGDEDRSTWIGRRVWGVGADGKRHRGSIVYVVSDHPSAAPTVVICVDDDRAVIVFEVALRGTDWGFVDL